MTSMLGSPRPRENTLVLKRILIRMVVGSGFYLVDVVVKLFQRLE